MCKTTLHHLACGHTRNHYTKFCLCESNFDAGEVDGYCRKCMMEWDGIIPTVIEDIRAEVQKGIKTREESGLDGSPGGPVRGVDPAFLELMGVSNGVQPVAAPQPGRMGHAAPNFDGGTQSGVVLSELFGGQSCELSQRQPTGPQLEQPFELSMGRYNGGPEVHEHGVPKHVPIKARLFTGDQLPVEHCELTAQDGVFGSVPEVQNPEEPQADAVRETKARRKSVAGAKEKTPKPGKKVQGVEGGAPREGTLDRDEASANPKTPRGATASRARASSTRGGASGRGRQVEQGESARMSKAPSIRETIEPVETPKRGGNRVRGRGAAASRGRIGEVGSQSGSRSVSRTSGVAELKVEEQSEAETAKPPPKKRGRKPKAQKEMN